MVFGCLRVESKGKRLWEGEHLSWIQEAGEPWVRMNTGFCENLSMRTYHQVKWDSNTFSGPKGLLLGLAEGSLCSLLPLQGMIRPTHTEGPFESLQFPASPEPVQAAEFNYRALFKWWKGKNSGKGSCCGWAVGV